MRQRSVMGMLLAVALAAPAPAADEGAATQTTEVRLLDEAPNYTAALLSQWSGKDVARGFAAAEEDTEPFGRLRDIAPPEEVPLTWCVQLALENNTDLRIQRLGPLGARAEVRRARSVFDPTFFSDMSLDRDVRPSSFTLESSAIPVQHQFSASSGIRKLLVSGGDLSATWTNSRSKSNSTLAGLVPEYRTDFLLSLNQPLLRDFGLFFTTLLVRVAKNAETKAVYDYEALVATIVQRVEEAYWGVVEAREQVRVMEKGLAAAKELRRQNEGKFKVGTVPKTAVLEAKAEVARREADLIAARNAESIARDTLRALVNFRRPNSKALVAIEPSDTPEVIPYTIELERSLANALEKRPELKAAKLDVRGKAMQLKVAENQLLPRLNAVGSIGTNGIGGKAVAQEVIDFETGELRTVMNPFGGSYAETLNRGVDGRFYTYSAGLSIEIPIDNALAKADYAQARVDLEMSRRTLRKWQEDITLEVRTAVTRLQASLSSIKARRIARKLAEENLRNQQARYDVGLATTKDLLDFQDRLTQAGAAEITALTTYNIDLAALRRAEGTLLATRNIVVEGAEEEPTPWWAVF